MTYVQNFNDLTREIYQQIWQLHFIVETLVENMRQRMLKNPNFDISKAFRDIDANSKGHITAQYVSKNLMLS